MKSKNNEVSIGVFVYNEEKNIGNILSALINQKIKKIKIREIIVVSSGSIDNTNKIAKRFEKKNNKIKLIIQKTRQGKMAAINLFLKKMSGKIAVIESGDTIPRDNCVEELCKPFLENKQLGMTGARSIPVDDKNTFLGYVIHYWWWMSYHMPRLGEMVAFRKNLVNEIPLNATLDEAWIEALIIKQNYKIKNIKTAVISNKGADTIKDLIIQRKRNYIGHKRLISEKGYSVESFNFLRMFVLTLKFLSKEPSLKHLIWLLRGAIIEFYSRLRGFIDLKFKNKNPYIWDIAKTTKKVQ